MDCQVCKLKNAYSYNFARYVCRGDKIKPGNRQAAHNIIKNGGRHTICRQSEFLPPQVIALKEEDG